MTEYENHFKFHMDTDAIDNVIKSTYNHRIFEKTDFFKDGIPEWLADSFIITEPFNELMTDIKQILNRDKFIKTSDNNDLVELVHQQGLKLYHIGDTLYAAKSCENGREVNNIVEGGQQYRRNESDGYRVKWVPSIKEPHTIYYEDGGVEFVEDIKFKFVDKTLYK